MVPGIFVLLEEALQGLGSRLNTTSRGYKTVLLEKYDFAKGTSSRSTKLVHGGVRYLQQGNIKLVMDALKERGIMKKNAPHCTLTDIKKGRILINLFIIMVQMKRAYAP